MSFKKINLDLLEVLNAHGISEPNEFQKLLIPNIKSGANLIGIGPKGVGKSTTILISVLNKLGFAAQGDNPRAVIFVENRAAALKLEEAFQPLIHRTDLRIFSVYEEGDLTFQKNTIYPGMDILIATPKRFSKLYFLNGINLNELEMLIVEDADFLSRGVGHTTIDRITESLKKGQYLVFAEKLSNLSKIRELFMAKAKVFKL